MASAIDASSHGIVCVSKEYTKSVNCAKESVYMSQCLKYKRMQDIIYVMLQQDFLPENMTGPLALNIGSSLYYELFSEASLETVSTKISERLMKSSTVNACTAVVAMSTTKSSTTTDPNRSTSNPPMASQQSLAPTDAVLKDDDDDKKKQQESFKIDYNQLSRDLILVSVTATVILAVLTFMSSRSQRR